MAASYQSTKAFEKYIFAKKFRYGLRIAKHEMMMKAFFCNLMLLWSKNLGVGMSGAFLDWNLGLVHTTHSLF